MLIAIVNIVKSGERQICLLLPLKRALDDFIAVIKVLIAILLSYPLFSCC